MHAKKRWKSTCERKPLYHLNVECYNEIYFRKGQKNKGIWKLIKDSLQQKVLPVDLLQAHAKQIS